MKAAGRFAGIDRARATSAGLAALALVVAALLQGPAERSFATHMSQHLLLAFVVPPLLLLALGARGRGRILGSAWAAPIRAAANPIAAAVLFNAILLAAHLPWTLAVAEASPPLHAAIHGAMVVGGLLLWIPVLGGLPGPAPLGPTPRMLYLVIQAPVQMSIATLLALEGDAFDQRLAAALMAFGGAALALTGIAGWMAQPGDKRI